MIFKKIRVEKHQIGLVFRDGAFEQLLNQGVHRMMDFRSRISTYIASMRDPVFQHPLLAEIIKSEAFNELGEVVDLKDDQRALVWANGRFHRILMPGLYILWNQPNELRWEIVDANQVQFEHESMNTIRRSQDAEHALDICEIGRHHAGVLFINGEFADVLKPGCYAFWNFTKTALVKEVDLRDQAMDVNGQDLITSDKVTLRINAIATFRIDDPRRAVSVSQDATQSLYRAVQLALRSVVGTRSLDNFLSDKDSVAAEAFEQLKTRAESMGLKLVDLGIRDIILPGDMKDLMNKVTEAKKAAEANLIFRREETSAMRSQANTAKLLESNPVLMRLRELEVLEKVSQNSNLQIVLGESGLGDRLTKLI